MRRTLQYLRFNYTIMDAPTDASVIVSVFANFKPFNFKPFCICGFEIRRSRKFAEAGY